MAEAASTEATRRWVGIDEAGYGPNLGPLVMTAVIAEGPGEQRPDLWADLGGAVCRAGEAPERLWIDDSKALYRGGHGRDRLEAACLATVAASGRTVPGTFGGLLALLDAGTLAEAELTPWLDADDLMLPHPDTRARLDGSDDLRALVRAPWRIVAIRSVVVGPAQFNRELGQTDSKARVHFAAFARLLSALWTMAADGVPTTVRGDKHGGRHFYLEALLDALPEVWIDRGPEGPDLSHYTVRGSGRRLELSLQPRADAEDGLVALASIVSKTVRECWMDIFNAHWTARIPGLRRTAGYPLDAARFRSAIEGECAARGLEPHVWWRAR